MNVSQTGHDEASRFVLTEISHWKSTLQSYALDSCDLFYYGSPEEGPVKVFLYTLVLDDGTPLLAGNEQMITESGQVIPIRTFMSFLVVSAPPGQAIDANRILPEKFNALGTSFSQNLTQVGCSVFSCIKSSILRRYNLWKVPGTFASPNASLCQYSGSGKSKIAREFTLRGPGIGITLRASDFEDAYPPQNNLSQRLNELISTAGNLDPRMDLTERAADENSKVASLLNFFASLTTTYLQELVDHACSLCNSLDLHESPESVLERSYKEVGPRLPLTSSTQDATNYAYNLCPSDKFEDMLPYYCKIDPDIPSAFVLKSALPSVGPSNQSILTIKNVGGYIKELLKNPKQFLICRQQTPEPFNSICDALSRIVAEFPFILVIDEAHLLANIFFQYNSDSGRVTYNGFQILRRALTYLDQETPLIVLTLGTRSILLDMNPPDIDSYRASRARAFMPPIILSGNFDIFTNVKGFSVTDFEPNYTNLTNPLAFKLLASLGSPIWSSLLFNSIVDTAILKLKNSTVDNSEDFFVSWMIRTGAMANPNSAATESLVAKRMACLFNLSSDLKSMSIFYPSQPIFGIAARRMLLESHHREFFSALENNRSLMESNSGEMAENFAFMNALRAIDLSPNKALPCHNRDEYRERLKEICIDCPELADLWKTKSFLLEKNPSDSNQAAPTDQEAPEDVDMEAGPIEEAIDVDDHLFNFDFRSVYHVTTVREFLLRHYGESISRQIDSFPEVLLNGILNASHFVKLQSVPSFDESCTAGYALPLPNNVKGNSSRRYIDRSLLRLGLARQCAFSMPPGHFGIDGIVPVCLNVRDRKGRPVYTFIAIQMKKNKRGSLDDALSMQARLHFINCPYADSHVNTEPDASCNQCENSEGLDLIYGYQVALLVSFGEPYKESKTENVLEYYGQSLNLSAALSLLYGEKAAMSNGNELISMKSQSRPLSLSSPQILHTLHFGNNLRILNASWNDAVVRVTPDANLQIVDRSTSTLALKLNRSRGNRQQAIINRQHRLFCISSDGLELFSHLYGSFPSRSIAAAKRLLDPCLQFGDTSTVDMPIMISALLRESILPNYNETLLLWRGLPMDNDEYQQLHFDSLLEEARKNIKTFQL